MLTTEQRRLGAARSIESRRIAIQWRRDQIAILRVVRPAMSAEEIARLMKCSPSTVRGDWRALGGAAAKK